MPDSRFYEANFLQKDDLTDSSDENTNSEIAMNGNEFNRGAKKSIHQSSEEENQAESAFVSSSDFQVDLNYHQQYLAAMNKPLQVHGAKFQLGDIVLLKKDFDNNQKNRKYAFDAVFYSDNFVVKMLYPNGFLQIQNLVNLELKTVSSNRIKKISRPHSSNIE